MNPVLEAALRYLSMGWSVIPVNSRIKGGATLPWKEFQSRRANEEEVRRWFDRQNPPGVAIITGAISGLDVLDFDRHGEDDGLEIAKSLHGWESEGPTVRTGGGGLHAYYKHSDGVSTKVGIATAIDLRGEGGFVYAPPSLHPSGERYRWEQAPWDPERPLPELPEWVLTVIRAEANGELAREAKAIEDLDPLAAALANGVEAGERNDVCARLAGRYLAMGLGNDEVCLMLRQWNGKNRPPLDDAEIVKVVDSIARKEALKRGERRETGREVNDPGDREAALRALSERFGVPIDDIVRIGGGRPLYQFVCGTDVAELAARQLLNQSTWRATVLAVTRRVPALIGRGSRQGWDYWLQLMLDVARSVEPGEEATNIGQLREWVRGYLEANRPATEGDRETLPGDPRMHEGRVYMHLGQVRKFVLAEHGLKVDGQTMAQLVAAAGWERQTIHILMPGKAGGRTTRSMWAPPEGWEAVPQSREGGIDNAG